MQSCHGAGENFEYKTSGFITAFRETSSVCCPARCTEDEISHKTRCSKIFPLPYTKWATTHSPLCLHLSVFQLFYYAICVFVESITFMHYRPLKKKLLAKADSLGKKVHFAHLLSNNRLQTRNENQLVWVGFYKFNTSIIPVIYFSHLIIHLNYWLYKTD